MTEPNLGGSQSVLNSAESVRWDGFLPRNFCELKDAQNLCSFTDINFRQWATKISLQPSFRKYSVSPRIRPLQISPSSHISPCCFFYYDIFMYFKAYFKA